MNPVLMSPVNDNMFYFVKYARVNGRRADAKLHAYVADVIKLSDILS